MRLVCIFDLPTKTLTDQREYRHFRKFLIKSGFIMTQESVYVKLCPNNVTAGNVIDSVKKHAPPAGDVQLMMLTEKEYQKTVYVVGEKKSDVIDSTERLIFL